MSVSESDEDDCQSILSAKTVDELTATLVRLSHSIGMAHATGTVVRDISATQSEFTSFGTFPNGYEQHFHDYALGKSDPVMQWLKRSSLPLIWGADYYARHSQLSQWETMDQFGLSEGISVAMHMPGGRHFIFGVDGPDKISASASVRTELLGKIQLWMVHIEAACQKLGGAYASAQAPAVVVLTERELDILRWSSEGKTAWEIGVILSLSERTVQKYIDAAVSKLDCTSKMQAVARALRFGLLY